MHGDPLAIVPLLSAILYLWLITLIRRRAPHAGSARPFVVLLTLLCVSSAASVAWRLTVDPTLERWLLRVLLANALSVGAAFLFLVQAQYPSRWAGRARRVAFAAAAVTVSSALTGAAEQVVLTPGATPGAAPIALFGASMIMWAASFLLGFGYLVGIHRASRDPFERNRMKYMGLTTALVAIGALTNTVGALRALPIDQGAYAAAAAVYAFSIVRYRLYDINVAVRRSVVSVATALMVGPIFFVAIGLVFPSLRADLFTAVGLLRGLGVAVFVGSVAPSVRAGGQRLLDRLLLGGHADRRDVVDPALFDSAFDDSQAGVRRLAFTVTERLQRALESGSVAMLLHDAEHEELRLSAMSGPFALLHAEWTIRENNALLLAAATDPEVITPLALRKLADATSVPAADTAEFGPYREMLLAPMLSRGEIVGCLFVGPKVYDAAFTIEETELLRIAAGQAAIAVQNAQLIEELARRADTDHLTGLPNHRKLHEVLAQVLDEAISGQRACSVAMVDIDNFKLLNDVHGHQVGDDALRAIASQLRASLPGEAVVGRYGGDEFLVILKGVERAEAAQLMVAAERAVRRVTLLGDPGPDGRTARLPARISWGVAACPQDGITARGLVSAADSQLMQHRFSMRRSGTIHTKQRRTVRQLLEQDPEKLRIARALLDIIDAKDPYTSEHSQQIASFALLVADEIGLSDRDRYAMWLGSLLHDVGKIGTPAEILRKPGGLSAEELDQMRQHPALGESMVRGLLDIQEVADIVGCHHERYDGTGYPRGLVGEEIPRLARQVSVADAFSAMVHDRPYRKGLSWEDAVVELRRCAGTQFDPEMVEIFVRAIGHEQSAADRRVA